MAKKQQDIVLAPLEDGNQKYAIRSNADIVCMSGGTGSGKQQPLDCKILTENGWVLMGDIRIGDRLVSPLNDEPSVVTGIYPQGVSPSYKVTTSDGRVTRCGMEHLWRVYTEKQVDKTHHGCKNSFFVKTTREIVEEYINKGKRIFIPVCSPYNGKEAQLPIDPYVLGIWLGDGCKGHASFTISNDEPDIIENIAKRMRSSFTLHAAYNYSNRIHKSDDVSSAMKYIDEIELNVYSRERFIPREYLNASKEQRLELLKGLMDSDGNVEEKNRYSFSTTSTRLKDDFIELCRSLGYIVGERKDNRTQYKSGVSWDISIQTNDVIFSSKKHLGKYNSNLKKYASKNREYKHDFVRIVSVEYDGDVEQQCIMVSNKDHLYITDDYIVTHNTLALYYAPIDYLSQNDNAKIICFMRNVSDFWASGKVADTLKKMYPLIDRSVKKQPHDPIGEIIRNQVDMGMKLYNGSEIKFQQLDNESPIIIDKIAKGLQAKKLIFDECNKFEWRTITAFMPRLRSDSSGKAQIFLAQNPERECFMRKLCGKGPHGGGWINDDGTVDKSMDGVVMFFNMQDGDLDKTYFGRTKREVYEKCKEHIDALIAIDPDMTYEDFILSMVFYTFDVRDNKKMLSKNKGYRGLAANSSTAQSAYSANWNYSITDEEEDNVDLSNVQVTHADIERMFLPVEIPANSELLKRFMTVDFATTGTDNLVMKYWELWSKFGFICRDIKFSMKNDAAQGVMMMTDFRERHGLDERNMIIDVQGAVFLKNVYRQAILFAGASQASIRSKNQYKTLKDESGHLAMQMIRAGLIHYEPNLANMRYTHQRLGQGGATTVLRHMKFESVIFQFDKTPNGRIVMVEKDEQKKMMKQISPDLTDNIIMLCGGTYHDCYRALSEDAGYMRQTIASDELLRALDVNNNNGGFRPEDGLIQRKKIRNADEILKILSAI